LENAKSHFERKVRWHPLEIVFWLCTLLPFFVTPSYLSLASQIAITALFALSLDLILGYAGIVSLGHAAFFGVGAYTAGLLAKHYWSEPLTGLVLAALLAGLVGYAMSHIVVRFRHLALIMLTLGLGLLLHEAANSASALTGGADGLQGFKVPGGARLQVRHVRPRRVCLLARRALRLFSEWPEESFIRPSAFALRGIRENATRMPAIGAPSRAHLRKAYTIAAVLAGIAGALLTHTTSTVSLRPFPSAARQTCW
jgi:branched-chain amino acid transport system permease protein